jgi:hypothetical protein
MVCRFPRRWGRQPSMFTQPHFHRRTICSNHRRHWNSLAAVLIALAFSSVGNAQNSETPASAELHAKALIYGEAWQSGDVSPPFARFRAWAERYVTSGLPNKSQGLSSVQISEGVALAIKRRKIFAELIESDPERAIALTVPASIRSKLPDEVVRELESRVSGIGDLSVVIACPAIGGPPPEPIERRVYLEQQVYRAFTYNRRANQTTKIGIPLHGVAIDDRLALAESCVRELEQDEIPNPSEPIVDIGPKGSETVSPLPGVLGEVGKTIFRFESRKDLIEAETRLENAEAGLGPHPRALDLKERARSREETLEPDGWTAGNQNVLIIRVDFSDLPGDPVRRGGSTVYTAAYVQNFSDNQITPYYQVSSYGITSLTNTATPQLYRMPHPASYYATLGGSCEGNCQLHADARNAAAANYTLANYDRIIVLFSWLGTSRIRSSRMAGERKWADRMFG